jgi:hypothetical protein
MKEVCKEDYQLGLNEDQIGYLEANYGHASTSLDLRKPAYYDKMMEIYKSMEGSNNG